VYPHAVGAAAAAAQPGTLVIRDFAYSAVSVPAGGVVTVRNEDPAAHTVTSTQKGLFDVLTPPSTTTRFVAPARPGRYPFSCTYHGNMTGVLVVT
jgi:plastocyanin